MLDLVNLRTTTLVRLYWSARDTRRGVRAANIMCRALNEILSRKDRLSADAAFNLSATYSQDPTLLNWPVRS